MTKGEEVTCYNKGCGQSFNPSDNGDGRFTKVFSRTIS